MKKNRGFTLIEVLISLVLLTFVILISSTLFDRAIQNTPQMRKIAQINAKSTSEIEKGIVNAQYLVQEKEANSSDQDKLKKILDNFVLPNSSFDGQFETVDVNYKIGSIDVKKAKGYFLSVNPLRDKNEVPKAKINSSSASDYLNTFVGIGYKIYQALPPGIEIDADMNNIVLAQGGKALNIKGRYTVEEKNRPKFFSANFRLLRTGRMYNDGIIMTPYTDSYPQDQVTKERVFSQFVGEATKMFDPNGATLDLTKVKIDDADRDAIPPYKDDADYASRYLRSISRSFIVMGNIINRDGNISTAVYSKPFNVMNLGYADKILGMYQTDYAIVESPTDGKRYSALDYKSGSEYLTFNDSDRNNPIYEFDWKDKDIRNMNSIKVNNQNISSEHKDIEVEKGFYPVDGAFNSDILDGARKAYGYSLYYDQEDAPVKVKLTDTGEAYDYEKDKNTLIVKFNPLNYYREYLEKDDSERKGIGAYALLSYNMDENGKVINPYVKDIGSMAGLMVYVLPNGEIRINTARYKDLKVLGKRVYGYEYTDKVATTADMRKELNLYEISNLYKNDNTGSGFKFDRLLSPYAESSGVRDGREDYSIMMLSLGNIGYESLPGASTTIGVNINMFTRKNKDELNIESVPILNISSLKKNYDIDFKFGQKIKQIHTGHDKSDDFVTEELPQGVDNMAMEISDILYFQKAVMIERSGGLAFDFSNGFKNTKLRDNIVANVFSLYQSYLTEREATEGKFYNSYTGG